MADAAVSSSNTLKRHQMSNKCWLRRILIPFWGIRLLTAVFLLIVAGLAFYEAPSSTVKVEGPQTQAPSRTLDVGAVLGLTWCSATIISDLGEIVLFLLKLYGPLMAVVIYCIKTIVWIALFILFSIGATESYARGLAIFYVIVIVVTVVGQLIYSSVVLYRLRTGHYQNRGSYMSVRSSSLMYPNRYSTYNENATGIRFLLSEPELTPISGRSTEFISNESRMERAYEMQPKRSYE